MLLPAERSEPCLTPVLLTGVPAGFPSPADDYIDRWLDLNEYLVRNKASTFFMRVTGDSMEGAGIFDGDLLVVDKSLEPVDGQVVIAEIDGSIRVKRLLRKGERCWLESANPKYPLVEVRDEGARIWGVVTSSIHPLSKSSHVRVG